MLIRFTVENFLSFNERFDFNMIASPETNHQHHVVKDDSPESIGLLKTAVIYGANASGKSNLVKAMYFARDIIVNGVDKNANIPLRKFKLDQNCYDKPSRFEFEFRANQKQYAYGFVLDTSQIYEEWLYEIGISLEEMIFERNADNISFNFEHRLLCELVEREKDRLSYEAEGTRKNLLFLTNCKERNLNIFEDVYQWFWKLIFVFPRSQADRNFIKENIQRFSDILITLDLGIMRMDIKQQPFNNCDIPEDMKEAVQKEFDDKDTLAFTEMRAKSYSGLISMDFVVNREEKGSSDLKIFELLVIKKDINGNDVDFKIPEESDGTQRIIDLISILILGSKVDYVFVIDEIESHLHPLLVKKIFQLFLDISKKSASQLIATTHAVTILNIKDLFRKDEIWFVEKDKTGQSIGYSLANTDVENLDLCKGYLNGRFGAIPFLEDIKNLGWL